MHRRNKICSMATAAAPAIMNLACGSLVPGKTHILPIIACTRMLQGSGALKYHETKKNELSKFANVMAFDHVSKKEKETFLDILHMYETEQTARKGHVDFVKAAMRYMDEFGVNEDLEAYKRLIDILPKGKFISSSPMAADFMHYPRQQQIIIDLLEKMETNGVIPDWETQQMLLNIFGRFGIPLRKFGRMMYWMPKFKNLNPWPTPRPVPTDAMELARIAIDKITSVDVQTQVVAFDTADVPDSVDKTWIVSGMSMNQEELLKKHPPDVACYVEGPYKVWVAHMPVDYFVLRADPKDFVKVQIDNDDVSKITIPFWDDMTKAIGPVPSVHEQEDATIFAVCATGTSSKDSLLSWIRCLQRRNPILEKIPVLFTFTSHVTDQQAITDGKSDEEKPPPPPEIRKIGGNL